MKEYLKLKFSNFPTKFQNLKLVKINYYNLFIFLQILISTQDFIFFFWSKIKINTKTIQINKKNLFL